MGGLIAQFVLIALVVVVAGTLLARFADKLGMITGMGRCVARVNNEFAGTASRLQGRYDSRSGFNPGRPAGKLTV